MKIRLIGSGHSFCRHPLIPVSLLVQAGDGNLVINCPPQIGSKLESIDMSIADIDVWMMTSAKIMASGGLEEVCSLKRAKPPIVAAPSLLMSVLDKLYYLNKATRQKVKTVRSSYVMMADEHF